MNSAATLQQEKQHTILGDGEGIWRSEKAANPGKWLAAVSFRYVIGTTAQEVICFG